MPWASKNYNISETERATGDVLVKAEQSDFQEIFRRRPEGSPPRSRGLEVPKTSDCNNNIEVAGEVKGKQRPGGQSEEDASIQLGRWDPTGRVPSKIQDQAS